MLIRKLWGVEQVKLGKSWWGGKRKRGPSILSLVPESLSRLSEEGGKLHGKVKHWEAGRRKLSWPGLENSRTQA